MTHSLPSACPLPPLRPGRAAPDELLASRSRPGADWPGVPGVMIAERRLGGVRVVELVPPEAGPGAYLHFHGGGYRQGSPERIVGALAQVAAKARCRIIAPAYALAPEQPYPAALHDAAQVLAAMAEEAPGAPLVIGGDSAGGGLAAAACLAFAAALPSLQGAALISPWLDLAATAPTFERCAASDQLFSRDAALAAAELYLQGIPAGTPLASPLRARSLAAMPPTMLIAGSAEVLLQDSLDFAGRLAAEHIGVELVVVPHMQHVSPLLFPGLPSTARTLAALARFIARHLAGERTEADPV